MHKQIAACKMVEEYSLYVVFDEINVCAILFYGVIRIVLKPEQNRMAQWNIVLGNISAWWI